jgi:thiamine-phosphate pyrophosphorylase
MKPLPRLMLVTQRARIKPDFESALEAALRGGARLVQLREKELPHDELLSLARRTKTLCQKYSATLIINGAPEVARALNAGLHMPEGAPLPGRCALYGISVHTLDSACHAAARGADYLVFGSVFETQSHPGAVPMGLDMLREACAAVNVPVFAIGGVTAQNAKTCIEAGAHGIAVIGAAWDAEDVEAAVRELIYGIG